MRVEACGVQVQHTSNAIRHKTTQALVAGHIDCIEVVQGAPGRRDGACELVLVH